MRRIAPIDSTAHLLQAFAGGLPALLAVLTLLGIQGLDNTDPEGSAHEDAENRDNEKIGLWIAVLRVIKPWPAVVDVFASHERTRERAHAQQYALPGMPCQRLPLPLPFFFTRLGRALTLATVS